jgi:hypothetical protein
MTIRIHLLGGDFVDTERYTYEQALKLRAEGADIEVGGTDEFVGLSPFPGARVEPRRAIAQSAISEIAEL